MVSGLRYFSVLSMLLQLNSIPVRKVLPQTIDGKAYWENLGVVPDVIDAAPPESITIEYDGGLAVVGGNELTPTQVQNEPVKIEWSFQPGDLFTFCLTDPDAPSREVPLLREFQHWLVVNVPGNDLKKGETLTTYLGSQPPLLSGLHRYTFLVYKQPQYLTCDEDRLPNKTLKGRGKFSIQKFAAKYNLGQPVAGNVFLARWDGLVTQLDGGLEKLKD
ncbi:protein D3 [Daphnia magna]|uniref:protein D3 n=1 Tax=Daphnia magna TaxID=35525 RepID=UPI001E1BB896|nr:protein D3 [Daphnia magna]